MPTVLVSLHSFTPVYAGVARPWHIGTLYHRDTRLPPLLLKLLRAEPDLVVGDNEPYAVSDETDYTIPVHGETRGLMNSGIEIRQDLIADPAGQQPMGGPAGADLWRDRSDAARAAADLIATTRPRQRQPDAAADHEAAGDARHQPRPPRREEQPRAAGQQRVDRIGDRGDHHEGDAEQRDLRDMIPAHVHELRNERAEEHQHLGI